MWFLMQKKQKFLMRTQSTSTANDEVRAQTNPPYVETTDISLGRDVKV